MVTIPSEVPHAAERQGIFYGGQTREVVQQFERGKCGRANNVI